MSDRSHIAVLSHRVPFPPNKGDKLRTYHQIRWLVDHGFDITVCASLEDDEERRNLEALRMETGVRTLSARSPPGWLRKVRGLLGGRPISVSFFHSKRLQRALDELLARSRIDAIMCSSSSMAEYVFRSEALRTDGDVSPLLVMDYMDVDSEKWREYARRATLPKSWIFDRESRLLGEYEREVYRRFDANLFVTDKECELFEGATGDAGAKLHAVGNGVELGPRPVDAARTPGRANLLFTGVMDYFPNEDAMLWFHAEMWPLIRSRWPGATLTIAGMSPTRKLQQLGRQEGVEVTGFVEDISRYHAEADVFVAPFRIARGIQNKILQAFAARVPVVTTGLGAEGIACTDGVDIAIADEPAEFANAVDRLLGDETRYERQRASARQLVERRYSWDAQGRALQKIIDEGIANRSDST